ncbi:hypothetical protein QO004_000071 [Rhizobium mesoamericanum]|uniref:hypothetical protein n=1 Tax=Rhizobium mesoamericanum TaxID=1079800 RepID=UPI002784005E|nr:hypothetical protein [Rhizobium mesoamericanum]MDQ0558298.1 hypothetical protein [Rhizobium mesoamericanum]
MFQSAKFIGKALIEAHRDGAVLHIPTDPANRDYGELMEWLNGEELEPWREPSRNLSEIQADLKASIDVAAERERLKYITGGAGQAMTYQQKSDEARRYFAMREAGETPISSGFPLLSAEIGITAPTLDEVATVVRGAFQEWQIIGGAIEAVRLGTKAAIDAATTEAAAEAAASSVAWP